MICALTVRTLKPGSFDQFREAFMGGMEDTPPEGFVRFDMLRNLENPDEVISFGFFDGTPEKLREVAAAEATPTSSSGSPRSSSRSAPTASTRSPRSASSSARRADRPPLPVSGR